MSCNGFVPHTEQCRDCGADYTQRQYNQYRCPACQKERNRITVRKASARYAVKHYKIEGLEALKAHALRTHREVGAVMGISHERVRQIENRAILKLMAMAEFVAETYGVVVD